MPRTAAPRRRPSRATGGAPRRDAARRRRRAPAVATGGIRWDRVSRVALLAVLGVILLLYVSPVHHWIVRTRAAGELRATVRDLERERARLEARARALRRPDALEREARRLGMVKRGERPFVVEPGQPAR